MTKVYTSEIDLFLGLNSARRFAPTRLDYARALPLLEEQCRAVLLRRGGRALSVRWIYELDDTGFISISEVPCLSLALFAEPFVVDDAEVVAA